MEWLVRTASNQIRGPFSEEEIKQKISEGELEMEDEVCGGADYWISLYEGEELHQKLGVTLPSRAALTGEETETETALDPQKTAEIDVAGTSRGSKTGTTKKIRKNADSASVFAAGASQPGAAHSAPPPVLALFLTLTALGFVVFLAYLLRGAQASG